ncbi:unnamed protein product [Leuciscus chuanchicus]
MTLRFQKSSKARGTGTMERRALAATKESLCRSILTPALPTFLSELLNYPDATSNLQPTCGLLPKVLSTACLCGTVPQQAPTLQQASQASCGPHTCTQKRATLPHREIRIQDRVFTAPERGISSISSQNIRMNVRVNKCFKGMSESSQAHTPGVTVQSLTISSSHLELNSPWLAL